MGRTGRHVARRAWCDHNVSRTPRSSARRTHLKSSAPYSDPRFTSAFLFLPFLRSSAATTSSAPLSLTTPPIHSISDLAKLTISCAVRLTRQRGWFHPPPPGLVRLKLQCWSRSTSNSSSRGLASHGMSTDLPLLNVADTKSRIAVSRSLRLALMAVLRPPSTMSKSGRRISSA